MDVRGRGLYVDTSFEVIMSCSIPLFQLAHVLLMSCRVCGVLRIRVSAGGRGLVVMSVLYKVVVSMSRAARRCVIWWRCACALGWLCVIAKVSSILACEQTSSGRIPIVFGANHGGVESLASFGYVFRSSISVTRRYWDRVVVGGGGLYLSSIDQK